MRADDYIRNSLYDIYIQYTISLSLELRKNHITNTRISKAPTPLKAGPQTHQCTHAKYTHAHPLGHLNYPTLAG